MRFLYLLLLVSLIWASPSTCDVLKSDFYGNYEGKSNEVKEMKHRALVGALAVTFQDPQQEYISYIETRATSDVFDTYIVQQTFDGVSVFINTYLITFSVDSGLISKRFMGTSDYSYFVDKSYTQWLADNRVLMMYKNKIEVLGCCNFIYI